MDLLPVLFKISISVADASSSVELSPDPPHIRQKAYEPDNCLQVEIFAGDAYDVPNDERMNS